MSSIVAVLLVAVVVLVVVETVNRVVGRGLRRRRGADVVPAAKFHLQEKRSR